MKEKSQAPNILTVRKKGIPVVNLSVCARKAPVREAAKNFVAALKEL